MYRIDFCVSDFFFMWFTFFQCFSVTNRTKTTRTLLKISNFFNYDFKHRVYMYVWCSYVLNVGYGSCISIMRTKWECPVALFTHTKKKNLRGFVKRTTVYQMVANFLPTFDRRNGWYINQSRQHRFKSWGGAVSVFQNTLTSNKKQNKTNRKLGNSQNRKHPKGGGYSL